MKVGSESCHYPSCSLILLKVLTGLRGECLVVSPCLLRGIRGIDRLLADNSSDHRDDVAVEHDVTEETELVCRVLMVQMDAMLTMECELVSSSPCPWTATSGAATTTISRGIVMIRKGKGFCKI